MKILYVSNSYGEDKTGGIETYLRSIIQPRKDRQILIFSRAWDNVSSNYKIIQYKNRGVLVTNVVNNIAFPKEFSKSYVNKKIDAIFTSYLKDQKPDIIHFQHLLGLSGNLPKIAKKMGIPTLLTLHDYWYLCPCTHLLTNDFKKCNGQNPQCVIDYHINHPSLMTSIYSMSPRVLRRLVSEKMKRKIKNYFVKLQNVNYSKKSIDKAKVQIARRSNFFLDVLKSVDYLITPSNFVAEKYSSFGIPRKSLHIIPHGVKSVILTSKNKPGKKITFAYFGSLYNYKGIDSLIEAFNGLLSEDVRLMIYADATSNPSYYSNIKKHANKHNIHFFGKYENRDLKYIYRKIDVVIVPSLSPETFNIVAWEAQSAGIPVIATNTGALPDLIKNKINGILYEPGNVAQLQDAIKNISKNPAVIEAMSKRTKKPITIAIHVSRLNKIYKSIMLAS